MGSTAPRFDNGLTTSAAWRLRGQAAYCSDGQVYTAASAVRWLQELGLIASPSALDATATAEDSGGVLCAPSFAGLAAPWWKPEAGAFITGLRLATGRGQIVRAVLDGIACQVAELADLTLPELGAPIGKLRVDGGLTRSQVLMQTQADLLQTPLDVYPSAHATALGTAACLLLGLDPGLAVAEAPYPWTPEATYVPARDAAEVARFRAAWRRAVDTTLEL